jgi:hypothetical protein
MKLQACFGNHSFSHLLLFGEALMVSTRAAIAMPRVKLCANRVLHRLERSAMPMAVLFFYPP